MVDGRPARSAPGVVVEPSVAVELEWVMDSVWHPDWRAVHPDLEHFFDEHPEIGAELESLWGPDRATSCGGFLELTVLAQTAGRLFATDAEVVLDALPEAMAHAPTDVARLPLHSETDEDRGAVLSRLSALRRSSTRRAHYLEVVRHVWEAARPAWEERGLPSVGRAVERLCRRMEAGAQWQELGECSCFTDRLPATVSAVGPGAEVAMIPSYFAHKGLYVDVGSRVLVSVRSEPMASAARARSERLARNLKTVADPTRLAILDTLRRSPCTVGELAGELSLAQPTVSNHVRLLREGGLVTDVRQGRNRRLVVRPDALDRLVDGLQEVLGPPAEPQP